MLSLLNDSHATVRRRAVEALGELEDGGSGCSSGPSAAAAQFGAHIAIDMQEAQWRAPLPCNKQRAKLGGQWEMSELLWRSLGTKMDSADSA